MDEIILLNRIRVDVGNISGSLSELLQYSGMAGFNDNYEPQERPRVVGTWTINDWYTQEQLAAAQTAFDGLTIVPNTNYLINFDNLAVQVLDSTKPNYNPAVAIILQGNKVGITLSESPISGGGGRWFLTKSEAAALAYTGGQIRHSYFFQQTSVSDTNNIIDGGNYVFTTFNEAKYFTNLFDERLNYYREGGQFQNCTFLEEFTFPDTQTILPYRMFVGCTKLHKLNLDNIVQSIRGGIGGTDLTITTLPPNLQIIGEDIGFNEIKSFTATEIPLSVTSINHWAFFDIESAYLHISSQTPPTLSGSGYHGVFGRISSSNNYPIYIGTGSSQEDDQAMIDNYKQQSTIWADYIDNAGIDSYHPIIDTWYNYLHPTT